MPQECQDAGYALPAAVLTTSRRSAFRQPSGANAFPWKTSPIPEFGSTQTIEAPFLSNHAELCRTSANVKPELINF